MAPDQPKGARLALAAAAGRPPVISFEPVASVAHGVCTGYRAVARFPLLEVGEPAVELACALAILKRRQELPANCFLSFGLSPAGVLARPLRDEDLAGVVLELREPASTGQTEAIVEALAELRTQGAAIALTGFGAGGGGCLQDLVELRPDFVVVDPELVDGARHDARRARVLAAIGALSGELDAWVVADGVAHVGDLDTLIGMDVPLVAGPLLGGPQEVMRGLPAVARAVLRSALARRENLLGGFARSVLECDRRPDVIARPMVMVDASHRPLEVFLPDGRRGSAHPALCVQASESPLEVARRASARPAEDRLVPVCLCDEVGALIGVIGVDALLAALADGLAGGPAPA